MQIYLAALVPDGAVESLLGDTQMMVYQATGWTSALALPPILPLHLSPEPHARTLFEELARPTRVALYIEGFETLDDYLWASVYPKNEVEVLKAALSSRAAPVDNSVKPENRGLADLVIVQGFYIAYAEGQGAAADALAELAGRPLAARAVRSTTIVDIRIQCHDDLGPWWAAISWEFVLSRRMKKRRDPP